MADLKFNTDLGRETSAQFGRCAAALEEELGRAQNAASTLEPEWRAPAADIFQSEFQNWAGQVRSVIEALRTLQQRLDREIVEWETTAANM